MTAPIRILHLEDDPNDAELIAMHLSSQGLSHELVRVKSQAEFTAALEKGGFDIILADNSGPAFSGRNALTLARQKLPHAAFVYVTGSAEGEATIASMKSGSDGFVLKHQLSELIPAIQRALQAKNK
jgi:sigma-B regulation protein RsbU (phosphoserine phosphatase)